ncbi:hypothetical protein [Melittangium boletus]|uniref:hypothetical protein n=1 Tax=Melittangium boletus TaxID=83453 RepID=UPI003DA5235C
MTSQPSFITKLFKTSALASLVIGGSMGHTAEPRAQDANAQIEAERALAAIAAKYDTPPDKLLMGLIDQRLARKQFIHGRLSPIGRDVYVSPSNPRNKILLNGVVEPWLGAPRTESELVLLTDKAVVGNIALPPGLSLHDLSFVWFQPEKVWFFNAQNGRWGHIVRPNEP